jgi:hypothetical protein
MGATGWMRVEVELKATPDCATWLAGLVAAEAASAALPGY